MFDYILRCLALALVVALFLALWCYFRVGYMFGLSDSPRVVWQRFIHSIGEDCAGDFDTCQSCK